MNVKCPQCQGGSVIEGSIYNLIDYVNPPAYFRPKKFPFYAVFKTTAEMNNTFFACSFCGFVWSKIDTQKLQPFVTKKESI